MYENRLAASMHLHTESLVRLTPTTLHYRTLETYVVANS